ncbi:MAG: RNA polymerase sigma factor [Planctomycetota bacterium]|nr:RNA polymerase sigma factor [Planctomycetota bacterium]
MQTTSMMIQALEEMRANPRESRALHFWELVERFRADLVNQAVTYLGNTVDAEDVAQESLCVAFRRLHELREPSKLGNWLRAINRLNCLEARRKKIQAREVRPATAEYEALADPAGEADPAAARLEQVAKAIDGLQDLYREVLVLRYWEHLSYAEIAQHLGVPLGTVKTRLARADEMLMRKLAPLMPAEGEERA